MTGFPCGSADKESTCNVGDLGLIPELGRSPGEGKGYPLQYSGLSPTKSCTWLRDFDFHFHDSHHMILIAYWEPFRVSVYCHRPSDECNRLRDKYIKMGFLGGRVVKNPSAIAGDARDRGYIPGSGRCPGVGNGNMLQHSSLENSMVRGAWWATTHGITKSRTQVSKHTQCTHTLKHTL